MKVLSLSLLAACATFGCASPSFSVPVGSDAGSMTIVDVTTEGPFAYRRDVLVDGFGRMSVVYVRETYDGGEVVVDRSEYKARVEPALSQIEEALPETCVAWIERCPAVRDEVAGLIEGGAIFRGGARSGVVAPYFWCEPQSVSHELKSVGEREFVDPLDTLAVFLVAGYEANEAYSGAETPERHARRYARRIVRAVTLLRCEADCLELGLLSDDYGATFYGWAAAVDAADGDPGRLAVELLEQHDLSAWD